jgi:hypothetical protein
LGFRKIKDKNMGIENEIPKKEQKEPASFAELGKKEKVSIDELKFSFEDYADGWAISAQVVISIIDRIDRTELTRKNLEELKKIAQKGIEAQGKNRTGAEPKTVEKEQGEYQKVINYISTKLSEIKE